MITAATTGRHEPQVESAVKDAKAKSAPVNPVDFFELHAKTIWHASLKPDDKASRLYSLSDNIYRYLRKADVDLVAKTRTDDWAKYSALRGKAYLQQLAEDLRRLAIVCQRDAAQAAIQTKGSPS